MPTFALKFTITTRKAGKEYRHNLLKDGKLVYYQYTTTPTIPKRIKAWMDQLNAKKGFSS